MCSADSWCIGVKHCLYVHDIYMMYSRQHSGNTQWCSPAAVVLYASVQLKQGGGGWSTLPLSHGECQGESYHCLHTPQIAFSWGEGVVFSCLLLSFLKTNSSSIFLVFVAFQILKQYFRKFNIQESWILDPGCCWPATRISSQIYSHYFLSCILCIF